MDRKGWSVSERSQDNLFYRPPFRLDCNMIRMLISEDAFVESPLIVGDVGVRLGFDRSWDIFTDQCLQVGFEPDPEECARIRVEYSERESQKLPRERVENIALWDSVGTRPLYVTRDPSNASCLIPNIDFFRRFPDQSSVEVVKTLQIETTTLDEYCKVNKTGFDILKIDVQGGELPILKGAIGQLHESVLAVVAEVAFVKLYQGEALFSEIDQFMRIHGFGMFDLDIRRWRRKPLPEAFDGLRVGQTIYGDVLFMKDPIEHNDLPSGISGKRTKILKLAALAEFFAMPDYALELIEFANRLQLIDNREKSRLAESLMTNQIIQRFSRIELSKK